MSLEYLCVLNAPYLFSIQSIPFNRSITTRTLSDLSYLEYPGTQTPFESRAIGRVPMALTFPIAPTPIPGQTSNLILSPKNINFVITIFYNTRVAGKKGGETNTQTLGYFSNYKLVARATPPLF